MKEESKQEIEKKILEDIEKTGFVSELKVVSSLIENKWQTEHSFTYEDKDENQSREIDVIGFKNISGRACSISINLVIEIKKSQKPWVIFTTQKKAAISWCANLFIIGKRWMKKNKRGDIEYKTHVLTLPDAREKCLRIDHMRVGKAFHELYKSPGDKSNIYSALISSGKAAKYYRDINYNEAEEIYNEGGHPSIMIFLPLVILDGHLFEVYNDNTGEVKVEQKDFIPVEIFYSSPNYKSKENHFGVVFAPDVITFNYLDSYIKDIETWQQSLFNAATDRIEKKKF